jgi:hypothetical protein
MMSCKDGPRQVIKGAVTHSAKVALPVVLRFIASIFDHFGCVAMRTFDSVCPTKLANHLVTLAIVDQSVNVQSHHAKMGLTVLPKTPNFTNDTERPTRKQYQPGTRNEPKKITFSDRHLFVVNNKSRNGAQRNDG